MFGVCRKLEQELHVDAIWFRVAFIALGVFHPLLSLGIYIALSIIL